MDYQVTKIKETKDKKLIMDAISRAADPVTTTLGPFGQTVMVDIGKTVKPTKDGVTIMSLQNYEDPWEEMASKLLYCLLYTSDAADE